MSKFHISGLLTLFLRLRTMVVYYLNCLYTLVTYSTNTMDPDQTAPLVHINGVLTLCLLVSSDDIICKHFGPSSGDKTPGVNWIQTVGHSEFNPERILKKINRQQKSMKNYQVDK